MGVLSSLNREQKEALGLLQIGTFLEYFDLMLYVHMAVLLNELFFPKYDAYTSSLLAALTFCLTFVFRPIGALIFGRIGDHFGRKATIILTTSMMAISCLVMANLPTYAQIGISAAWIMTICRIAQGMSSMGELIGAEIYVAETIPRPKSYPAVAFVSVASMLGAMVALAISCLVTSFLFNWRIAFWIGACIALIGAVARTRLRETPEFLEMKRQQIKEGLAEAFKDLSEEERRPPHLSWKEKVRFENLISFFLIYCGWPLTFYLGYLYFNPLLKENFGYAPNHIIVHNFFLSVIMVSSAIFWAYLSCRVHPIKILKIRGIVTLLLMIFMPFMAVNLSSSIELFLIQALIFIFPLAGAPADAIFIYHFPISRRFTFATFLYALTRALMYVITSFGLVYLGNYFGHFGIWFISLPVTLAFLYGVLHFESIERKTGHLFKPLLYPKN